MSSTKTPTLSSGSLGSANTEYSPFNFGSEFMDSCVEMPVGSTWDLSTKHMGKRQFCIKKGRKINESMMMPAYVAWRTDDRDSLEMKDNYMVPITFICDVYPHDKFGMFKGAVSEDEAKNYVGLFTKHMKLHMIFKDAKMKESWLKAIMEQYKECGAEIIEEVSKEK